MTARELVPTSDPMALLPPMEELTEEELRYAGKARAANTLRGYRSDWREWCMWCAHNGFDPLPAPAEAISRYLTDLARFGTKVGTMSRRLSALRFAHRLYALKDPTEHPRVIVVWEGIQRELGAPPDQALPLMPPDLTQVVEACPTVRTWKGDRPDEPDLAGLRDRALLTVGFFGALRRAELAAMRLRDLEQRRRGWVVHIPRSKTNQKGQQDELVVLPQVSDGRLAPITNLKRWLAAAGVRGDNDHVFRSVTRHNHLGQTISGTAINTLIQKAVLRSGLHPEPGWGTDDADEDEERMPRWSAHSLRAGFVTYAHLKGLSDRSIAHQTRHRSLSSIGPYIRVEEAFTDNAATQLGL